VVAQVERLRDAAEAVRVLGDPGDRQQLVDAARGEHQAVVAQLAAAALGIRPADLPLREVDGVDLAEHEPHAGQRLGERHGDPARIEHPGGDLGQQRQVEEVVGGVDQHDLDGVAGAPGQRARRRVPGEPAPDDHDALPCPWLRRHGLCRLWLCRLGMYRRHALRLPAYPGGQPAAALTGSSATPGDRPPGAARC
jgi:hypothetical protein